MTCNWILLDFWKLTYTWAYIVAYPSNLLSFRKRIVYGNRDLTRVVAEELGYVCEFLFGLFWLTNIPKVCRSRAGSELPHLGCCLVVKGKRSITMLCIMKLIFWLLVSDYKFNPSSTSIASWRTSTSYWGLVGCIRHCSTCCDSAQRSRSGYPMYRVLSLKCSWHESLQRKIPMIENYKAESWLA